MNEKEAFENVVEALNEAMFDDALWSVASARIDEACGTKGGVLTFGEQFGEDHIEIYVSRAYYRGLDRSDNLQEYYRNYYAGDEHLPRMRKLPDSKVLPIRQLYSEEELKTSRAYNEGAPLLDAQDGLEVRLDGPRGSRIVWGIADPVDDGGWSSSRIEMVARILPHLRQYVRVRSALVDAGALGVSSLGLLDNTGLGVVQLDRRGRIVAVNDRARLLLRRNDGLCDQDGYLGVAAPECEGVFWNLLARAMPRFGGQGVSGSMLVRRSTVGPQLVLHVEPVVGGESDFRPRAVGAVALVVDPRDRPGIDGDMVGAALGLTPAQTEVAVMLAEGLTMGQIAIATDRRYSTVRTHLKHIFRKLGVARQLDVARLVLALAGVPRRD